MIVEYEYETPRVSHHTVCLTTRVSHTHTHALVSCTFILYVFFMLGGSNRGSVPGQEDIYLVQCNALKVSYFITERAGGEGLVVL